MGRTGPIDLFVKIYVHEAAERLDLEKSCPIPFI